MELYFKLFKKLVVSVEIKPEKAEPVKPKHEKKGKKKLQQKPK